MKRTIKSSVAHLLFGVCMVTCLGLGFSAHATTEELHLTTGTTATLEAHSPTKVTCSSRTPTCEVKPNHTFGGPLFALYINGLQVSPSSTDHKEVLKDYKAYKEAGLCP